MPLYEYHCDACEHEFEALQKMSDAPLTRCPKCEQGQLQKMVSAAAFQLKGSGWYVTDFKDKKSNNTAAAADKTTTEAKTSTTV